MTFSIEDYRKELETSCTGGEGIPKLVEAVPAIFDTLESLIKDPDLSNKERTLVFAALGYFFIPDDLFPEEKLGQAGYIDDVILSLCIVQSIAESNAGKKVVARNWKLTQSMDDVFGNQLPSIIQSHPSEYVGVLSHFGLLPEDI